MTQPHIILEAKGLDLAFGGIKALDRAGFRVRRGEVASIIGPNGAGKTCLINCLTGYYRPQNGTAKFDGRELLGLPPHVIAGLGISRTFQSPAIYANLTVLENLMLARYLHTRASVFEAMLHFGRSRREEIEGRQKVEEVVAMARIEELRDRPVSVLSYGQRKMVEIAKAMAMEPKLLVMDEPMSGLDDLMKETVAEFILRVQQGGVTVVLVEHDMDVVMGLSQSVTVLDFGRNIAEGTPKEVSLDANVANAYLGVAGA